MIPYQDWFVCKTEEEIGKKIDNCRMRLAMRLAEDGLAPDKETITVMDSEIPAVMRAAGFLFARIVSVTTRPHAH